ncbi:MAG: hypothetical protein FWF82_01765 [Oscillospiraceae bacterium]|nr:hypothetical protein [Oscillospiraceae bacterium]
MPVVTVYANSAPPPPCILLIVKNVPEDAVYADMLIKINPDSSEYVDFNSVNGELFEIPDDSPIALFNQDGFMSFTFHYKDSLSEMSPQMYSSWHNGDVFAMFTGEGENSESYNQLYDIEENYHIIKIALFDEGGNIISISNEIDIKPRTVWNYFNSEIIYDAADNHASVIKETNAYVILFGMFISGFAFIRIALSVATEAAIAIPFKIKPVRKIIAVNLITQIILISFMRFSGIPYIKALIIGEAFVYIFEFICYMAIFKNTSKIKLAVYTVTANTVSLGVGILLNVFRVLERLV